MSSTLSSLQQYTPPFIDYTDPVVGVLYNAIDQALQDLSTNYQAVLDVLGILTATGSDLDRVAAWFGLIRLPNETDAALLVRIAAIVLPKTTPASLTYQLGLQDYSANVYEPTGGSLVGWSPLWNFNYDRVSISPTYTRASSATGPNGVEESTSVPTWLAQSNGTYWAGVFQGATQLLNNTDFSNASSGIPTNYTESLIAGDTMTITTDSAYPIQPDKIVQWVRASAGASASTITSPAATVSATTEYALSIYVNTAALSGGSIAFAVVDNTTSTTTVLTSQGVSSGYIRLYGTYTTGASASTIQLQLQFPAAVYGTVNFASPQVESGAGPTEYIRNSATSGTVARAASTLNYSGQVIPAWGQGTIGIGVYITPASQVYNNQYIMNCTVGDVTHLAIAWYYGAWDVTIGQDATHYIVLSSAGALSIGPHYFVVRWHEGMGVADFWIDGVKVASKSGTIYAPPSTDTNVTLNIGAFDSTNIQNNGYYGNITICNAWLEDSIISQWSYSVRTPIYACTMIQGNYENESLTSTSGGIEFGTAYYLMLDLAQASNGTSPFIFDVSGYDNGYAFQGSGSGISTQTFFSGEVGSILASNTVGGVDTQPWSKGNLQ